MVVRPGAACWRCLFESEPAADEMPPACAEAGVLGALAGVIGSMQAVEAIKLLLGGDALPPGGRLLTYDAWGGGVRVVAVSRRSDCGGCGVEVV